MATSEVDLEAESRTETAPSEETCLSKDVIFDVLKNRRRRNVLEYLQAEQRTVTLSELAEQIAAWENDIEVEELNSNQRKRVYVALYQIHLPKMDDAGIIEYDRDRGKITLSENADILRMYLSDDFGATDSWYQRYAALSVFGGGALFLSEVSGAMSVVSSVTLTVVLVGLFLLVSIAHMHTRRQTRRDLDAMLERIE